MTTSSSFSCEVTAIQSGRDRFFGLGAIPSLHAESLNDGLQIQHLLHAAGNVLADLINDEDDRLAWMPPGDEFEGALRRVCWLDMSALPRLAFA